MAQSTLGRLFDDTKGHGLMALVGVLLAVQGFGSALTKAVWDTDWGLMAVADKYLEVPGWAGIALGGAGLVIAVGGLLWGRRA